MWQNLLEDEEDLEGGGVVGVGGVGASDVGEVRELFLV